MRAWWGVGAAVLVIAIAFVADEVTGRLLKEASGNFRIRDVVWMAFVARAAFAAAVVSLAVLVLRGSRSRPAGAVLAIVGFYFGVLPPLAFFYLGDIVASMPPLAFETMRYSSTTGGFVLWVACAVMILGIVEVFWPTSIAAPAGSSSREDAVAR